MFATHMRLVVAAASALLIPVATPVRAQQPTTQQVQSALQNPADIAVLRQQIAASGLSADQIRARLQAAGYPSTLLDAYLPGGDTTSTTPSSDVLRAVKFLGLVDQQQATAAQTADSTSAKALAAKDTVKPESRIFGLDVFRSSTSQFEPDLAGPVDAGYRIGPRDVLALIITGGVETSYTLEVTREGFIVIPQVGQVYVANLTLAQVNDVLYQRLRSVYSGIGRDAGARTHFYVTVAKLRTNQVFVVGDVLRPGSYQISSVGTILTALYAAGGPTDDGSLRNVEVRRDGKTIGSLDVYDYLLRGDASHDLRLETGDVVFVPVHGPWVQIRGEIIRPATYELARGETLRDLIQEAGGFTAVAGRKRVLIHRIIPPAERSDTGGRDRTVLEVQSEQLASGFGPPVPLVRGDLVDVFSVADRVRNYISITGDVWNPGPQGLSAGMHLSDALRLAGGVKPDVHDVLITRLRSDQLREQLRATFTDSLGHLTRDPLLQEDDSITVFGQEDFRPDRWVAITGAVRNGGRFPWTDGLTLRDLVHLAGGLDDGAYLVDARIARLPASRVAGTLATEFVVPLDSSYLLERGLNGEYFGPPGIAPQVAKAPEIPLRPYDNVLILRQPNWAIGRTVTVLGEVKFPGQYALLSKTEKISDLVSRAGGLSSTAYAAGADFRRSDGNFGRVAVDLTAVFRDSTSRDNFVLEDGDTLFIPSYRPIVKVQGAVNSPLSLAYVPGKNVDYYIDGSGGPAYSADKGRIYVQQPNGIVERYKHRWWLIPDTRPTPQAGAVVVVPTKDPNDKKDLVALGTAVAQVLTGAVAIIAIITRL